MHQPNIRSTARGNSDAGFGEIDLETLRLFALDMLARLYAFRLLLMVIVLSCVGLWFIVYVRSTPVYTAETVIGPPSPSPINSMLTSMGGGATGKLLGAFSGNSNYAPYDQFQQVIVSQRMIQELAETKGFLPSVFRGAWDSQTNNWKKPTSLAGYVSAIKKLMHRPVVDHPDSEMLGSYLAQTLSIQPIKNSNTALSTLSAIDSKYLKVSYSASDPKEAERILNIIMNKADGIIRNQLLTDVNARIAFIESELQRVTPNEQKEALINILTNQEDIRMMLVADKRFSYQVVSMPHASYIPTSPLSPGRSLAIDLAMALALWVGLVMLEERIASLQKWLSFFKRPLDKAV